ncbi:MAG: AraC family transcriptional regulator [Myxococcota bacterium]|nr:AraC family transcriptional regulator [Myxococcota bacterium]
MRPSSGDILRESRIAELFLARVRTAGLDVAPLLQRFQLPPAVGAGEPILLPLSTFWELSEAVAETIGDPELGATTALGAGRGAYGLWEYVGRNAGTLGEALERFVRHRSLSDPNLKYSLEVKGREARYCFRVPGQRLGLGRHGNEFSLVMVKHLACDYVRSELTLRRAWFSHPRPARIDALTSAFGFEPVFDAGENGMAFDAALLELPVASADPALHSLLTRQLEARLTSAAPPANFVALVEARVQETLQQGGRPAVERIAEQLHMSGRTLQRRLTEHGTSFSAVIDEARKRVACVAVAENKLSLSEIAFLLGYSDVTPFTRAFKRWTGGTPQDARRGR